MKVGFLPLTLATIATGAVASCADAPDHATGGELRVSGDNAVFPQHPHGCATHDGGGSETTWISLYEDCFGPGKGAANCGAAGCHAQPGTGGGDVWVCGATKDSCYQGIRAQAHPPLAAVVSLDVPPDETRLLKILRKASPDGGTDTFMPQGQYNYVFTPQDLARIRAWIAAGALNDVDAADAGDASK